MKPRTLSPITKEKALELINEIPDGSQPVDITWFCEVLIILTQNQDFELRDALFSYFRDRKTQKDPFSNCLSNISCCYKNNKEK